MNVTANFTWEEATVTERRDLIEQNRREARAYSANILATCVMLERVRVLLGVPIIVNSLYRCPALNGALPGASRTSAHMQGLAADFIVPRFGSPYDVCRAIEASPIMDDVDQLIYEFGVWVHLGLPLNGGEPRRQVMSIFEPDTYLYGLQLRGAGPHGDAS